MTSDLTQKLLNRRIITFGLLGIFHIWDAYATLFALKANIAQELNPLMMVMLALGPTYFLAAKGFLVVWGSVILGFAWDNQKARCGAYALTTVYGILAAYELAVLGLYWLAQ